MMNNKEQKNPHKEFEKDIPKMKKPIIIMAP